jgi:hypothetical protein
MKMPILIIFTLQLIQILLLATLSQRWYFLKDKQELVRVVRISGNTTDTGIAMWNSDIVILQRNRDNELKDIPTFLRGERGNKGYSFK